MNNWFNYKDIGETGNILTRMLCGESIGYADTVRNTYIAWYIEKYVRHLTDESVADTLVYLVKSVVNSTDIADRLFIGLVAGQEFLLPDIDVSDIYFDAESHLVQSDKVCRLDYTVAISVKSLVDKLLCQCAYPETVKSALAFLIRENADLPILDSPSVSDFGVKEVILSDTYDKGDVISQFVAALFYGLGCFEETDECIRNHAYRSIDASDLISIEILEHVPFKHDTEMALKNISGIGRLVFVDRREVKDNEADRWMFGNCVELNSRMVYAVIDFMEEVLECELTVPNVVNYLSNCWKYGDHSDKARMMWTFLCGVNINEISGFSRSCESARLVVDDTEREGLSVLRLYVDGKLMSKRLPANTYYRVLVGFDFDSCGGRLGCYGTNLFNEIAVRNKDLMGLSSPGTQAAVYHLENLLQRDDIWDKPDMQLLRDMIFGIGVYGRDGRKFFVDGYVTFIDSSYILCDERMFSEKRCIHDIDMCEVYDYCYNNVTDCHVPSMFTKLVEYFAGEILPEFELTAIDHEQLIFQPRDDIEVGSPIENYYIPALRKVNMILRSNGISDYEVLSLYEELALAFYLKNKNSDN